MMLKMSLIQKQTVKLTMTPELRQAIQLLQFTSQELSAYLEEKALDNPLIQLIRPATSTPKRNQDSSNWMEQFGQAERTLAEYLHQQLIYQRISQRLKPIVEFLIEGLDENGYLTLTNKDLLEKFPQLTYEEWEESVSILQGLEPTGVGARSLQECLILQMKKAEFTEDAMTLIQNHFDNFANKKWHRISQTLKIPISDIQVLSDQISTLHPRPGSQFKKETSTYIMPDCIVSVENQNCMLQFVEDHLPKIQFQKNYYQKFQHSNDSAVQSFLRHKTEDFHWLLKSLESRKNNLQKIILAVVQKQEDFFKYGKSYIRPLTMKEISNELNIHESTVSRAIRGKYIQSTLGTFPLKMLFSSKVGNPEADYSSQQIKQFIQELVHSEDKKQPLSDQAIAEQIQKKSITISRRTVAKYRDQLGILPSTKRREFR